MNQLEQPAARRTHRGGIELADRRLALLTLLARFRFRHAEKYLMLDAGYWMPDTGCRSERSNPVSAIWHPASGIWYPSAKRLDPRPHVVDVRDARGRVHA